MENPTRRVGRFISELRHEGLPEEVRAALRRYFLDALGCGLYGYETPWGRTLSDYVAEAGGKPEATLWRAGSRAPAASVALALGTMIHSFELDDYHSGAKLHPGAAVWGAALPLAERLSADGRRLAQAAAAGYEVVIRASLAAGSVAVRRRGFHLTGICGTFGAAAACANLLGLDPERTTNALGIAGAQSAGIFAFIADGANTKRFHAGRAAQSGLMAAELAGRGFTGSTEVFEFEDGGFLQAFSGGGEAAALTREMGERWELLGVSHKPYACCGSIHSTLDAVRELRARRALRPEEVEEVKVFNSSVVKLQCSWPYQPATPMNAQMNIEFCTALMLREGRADPGGFTPERIADPELVALARRVKFTVDPQIDAIYPSAFPGKVAIRLKGSRRSSGSSRRGS
ncbi:MAG: MmgE/PrpD family protein [Nitrospinota bacterium]